MIHPTKLTLTAAGSLALRLDRSPPDLRVTWYLLASRRIKAEQIELNPLQLLLKKPRLVANLWTSRWTAALRQTPARSPVLPPLHTNDAERLTGARGVTADNRSQAGASPAPGPDRVRWYSHLTFIYQTQRKRRNPSRTGGICLRLRIKTQVLNYIFMYSSSATCHTRLHSRLHQNATVLMNNSPSLQKLNLRWMFWF